MPRSGERQSAAKGGLLGDAVPAQPLARELGGQSSDDVTALRNRAYALPFGGSLEGTTAPQWFNAGIRFANRIPDTDWLRQAA
ncbi:MAG: hypothetical protein K2X10_03180 [Hyphomicrobiales bacterium]|nr:hypothetical protein [Hyphomicrobiales bacterium]